MRVRINTLKRSVDFNITAEEGKLRIHLRSGSQHGHTFCKTWGGARRIIVHALDRLRMDELDAARGE